MKTSWWRQRHGEKMAQRKHMAASPAGMALAQASAYGGNAQYLISESRINIGGVKIMASS